MEQGAIVHGLSAYTAKKCRCEAVCRPAWAEYMRRYKRTPRRRGQLAVSHVDRQAFYPDKAPPRVRRLTGLGEQILAEAERRYGKKADDLLEQAVRRVGVNGFGFESVA